MKSFLFLFVTISVHAFAQESRFNDYNYLKQNAKNPENIKALFKVGAKLMRKPVPILEVEYFFPKNDSAVLIDYELGYWAVDYYGTIGYINELYLFSNEEIENLKKQKIRARKEYKKYQEKINVKKREIRKIELEAQRKINWIESDIRKIEREYEKRILKRFDSLDIAKQWEILTQTNLIDNHYHMISHSQHGVLSNEYWSKFLNRDHKKIIPFLVSKISDTTYSTVSICGFRMIFIGEISIYCLEKIFKVETQDILTLTEEEKEILNAKPRIIQKQELMYKLLFNKDRRALLIAAWEKKTRRFLK